MNRWRQLCLFDEQVNHRFQVAALAAAAQLPVGARPLAQDGQRILDLAARPQLVHHVVNEVEQSRLSICD